MYNHAPEDYPCPFCRIAAGIYDEHVTSAAEDIVYQDDRVMALVTATQSAANPAGVVVFPKAHHENVYELPVELAQPIFAAIQRVSRALKAVYQCDGITVQQHNEPAGCQTVWHYHVHVVPRYQGDGLGTIDGVEFALMPAGERAHHADRICASGVFPGCSA